MKKQNLQQRKGRRTAIWFGVNAVVFFLFFLAMLSITRGGMNNFSPELVSRMYDRVFRTVLWASLIFSLINLCRALECGIRTSRQAEQDE